MAQTASTQPTSTDPGIGGVNLDELDDQPIQRKLGEHTVPGQAGEPSEGNFAAPSPLPGHENTLNLEVSPDKLREAASGKKTEAPH